MLRLTLLGSNHCLCLQAAPAENAAETRRVHTPAAGGNVRTALQWTRREQCSKVTGHVACATQHTMQQSILLIRCICLVQLVLVTAQQALRVYVYELPRNLTQNVLAAHYQQQWLSGAYEYEADLWIYDKMVNGPWRVKDPAAANLFYIPVLPTRFLHQSLSATTGWQEALQLSGQYLQEALEHVQIQPFWSRNNGRDHFVTMTADSARCTHLRWLPRSLWGELSVIMHLGDLVMREEGIPCFDPDVDVLLPAYNPLEQEPLADVYSQERNVTVLYRFGVSGPTASHPYHTRLIRPELRKHFEASPLPGADWSASSISDTLVDMAHSIFCVCPPGVVAHTSRFWRALRRGCIPVTFFRAYQLPFSDMIDYSSATVNIQPDNIHTLHIVLAGILHDKDRLHALQQQVQILQQMLVWEYESGISQLLQDELLKRISVL